MGIDDIGVSKSTQIELYCTPKDLREIADKMEKHIKAARKNRNGGEEMFREYIQKKKISVVFCISIDRADEEIPYK